MVVTVGPSKQKSWLRPCAAAFVANFTHSWNISSFWIHLWPALGLSQCHFVNISILFLSSLLIVMIILKFQQVVDGQAFAAPVLC